MAKRGHRNMKNVRVANCGMGNPIIAFIFQIDQILNNNLYNDYMLSFWYETRSDNCEIWHEDKFRNLGIYHRYFANITQNVWVLLIAFRFSIKHRRLWM